MEKADTRITGLWHMLIQKNKLESISTSEFEEMAKSKGLQVVEVSQITYGFNFSHRAILLKTNDQKAIYPRLLLENNESYKSSIEANDNHQLFWEKVDWFSPPFIPRCKIYDPLKYHGIDIRNHASRPKHDIQSLFGTALADIYNLSNIIPTTEVTLKQSTTIEPHVPLIREAILAFYSGMKIVAIGALIPIVENILTKLVGNNNSKLVLIDKVHSCINSAIKNVIRDHYGEFTWIPPEYVDLKYLKVVDERIFMLETLRGWLVNSFYVKTKSYENVSGFNRHIFAHAKSDDWQNGDNFFRALGIIQALAFVEAYAIDNSAVSIFGPDPDSNCEALREEIFACLNYQSLKQQILTIQKQSRGLPFNPTSSDDGWLTRDSMLSDAMNNVIIPQLKEKGWDCFEVSDPEKDGEYVTVKSRKDDACLNVALLFSCATDNSIYRSLAKEHSYILYSGAQYHQEEFAQDVDAVVQPINAWSAPENA